MYKRRAGVLKVSGSRFGEVKGFVSYDSFLAEGQRV